jgi:hypothetical protein
VHVSDVLLYQGVDRHTISFVEFAKVSCIVRLRLSVAHSQVCAQVRRRHPLEDVAGVKLETIHKLILLVGGSVDELIWAITARFLVERADNASLDIHHIGHDGDVLAEAFIFFGGKEERLHG